MNYVRQMYTRWWRQGKAVLVVFNFIISQTILRGFLVSVAPKCRVHGHSIGFNPNIPRLKVAQIMD